MAKETVSGIFPSDFLFPIIIEFESRSILDEILDHVKAKIISHTSSTYWDAYVLSESSLFVSDDRIILKTCGTTTLLLGLNPIINHALNFASATVNKLFYSRKSMLKPQEQLFPHVNFDSETQYLKKMFPKGKSLIFGDKQLSENNQWVTFVYEETANSVSRTKKFFLSFFLEIS